MRQQEELEHEARLKIYRSKNRFARDQIFTQCLGEFKQNKTDGKQDKARAMTSKMSMLKRAMNEHVRDSGVQKDLIDFMKAVERLANAEQMVSQAVDNYGTIVQRDQWAMVMLDDWPLI